MRRYLPVRPSRFIEQNASNSKAILSKHRGGQVGYRVGATETWSGKRRWHR
jgi:hypothetical protein